MIRSTAFPALIFVLLFQSLTRANVENSDRKKQRRGSYENDVQHCFSLSTLPLMKQAAAFANI